ncbi:MAG TPA: hypothetical protein VFC00_40725 [Micromonosporaceae bacterium]|nr:hypothetical protein [Micromonosporaceae bacterium]
MSVSISGTFKQDQREYNGLEAIEEDLIKDPLTHRYGVIRYTTLRITEEVADGGVRTPTVRLLHIEPVDGDNEELVKGILLGVFQARTWSTPQDPLPLDDDGPVSERKSDKWLDPKAAAADTGKGRKGKTTPPAEFSTTEA